MTTDGASCWEHEEQLPEPLKKEMGHRGQSDFSRPNPVRFSDQYLLMTQIAWIIPGM